MTLLFLTESYLTGVFLDYYRQGMVEALAQLGFDVYVVKTNVPGMSGAYLQQVCQRIQPAVVLSINAAGVSLLPQGLKTERLLWFIDSYDRINSDWVPFFSQQGTVFLTGINRYVDRFLQRFPLMENRVKTVPFGAGIAHTAITQFKPRPTQVFFVGTAFGGPNVAGSLAKLLAGLPDRSTVCQAIHYHQQHYDFNIGQLLKDHEPADLKRPRDAFYYRSLVDDALSVQKRMQYLAALSHVNLALYGDSQEGWIAHILLSNPALFSRFSFCAITDPQALAQQYATSQISLNIQHHQAFDFGLSWRVFDIMACGSLLLTEGASREPLAALGFEENRHYVAFDTPEQLQQKVAHYQQNPEQAEAIIRQAHQQVMQGHRLHHRVTDLLQGADIACSTARQGTVIPLDHPDATLEKPKTPQKCWHMKTRLGKKYYLKLELMRQ
jgi:hypothetical protein